MNVQEKALARIMFRQKIFSSDGQAYQDLFVAIMELAVLGFRPVKPQGRIGDKKNDGYIPSEGRYYQVYAPENAADSESKAVKKLKKDFAGLMSYWNTVTPVQKYHFVVNDKFNGSFPTIETDLKWIESAHKLQECSIFLAKDLEDKLFSLTDDQITSIIGFIPNPENISLEYSAFKTVLEYVLGGTKSLGFKQALSAPDFQEKIVFNGLGTPAASLLVVGSYRSGEVDEYFKLNSKFEKQLVRDELNSKYQEAKQRNKDTGLKEEQDLIFFDLLTHCCPSEARHVQDAAIVLIAYFFESCDVFEDPNGAI